MNHRRFGRIAESNAPPYLSGSPLRVYGVTLGQIRKGASLAHGAGGSSLRYCLCIRRTSNRIKTLDYSKARS